MSDPEPQRRDEVFQNLDARLDALATSQRREPKPFGSEGGAGAGYRLIGELIGGMLAGLGLGWLLDRIAGTAPLGLIGGLLVGTGAAVFLVARSAGRMATTGTNTTGKNTGTNTLGETRTGMAPLSVSADEDDDRLD